MVVVYCTAMGWYWSRYFCATLGISVGIQPAMSFPKFWISTTAEMGRCQEFVNRRV